jgi:hypothetical protein
MRRFSLPTFPHSVASDGAVRAWISKLERAKRWVSERAAIKAEVTRAKETIDLLGMAKAITRLDALEAEIEAAANLAKRQKT